MYKALVVGLGMGQQYKDWLEELGWAVSTVDVDSKKNPTYTSVSQAVENNSFDLVYIGTPNWTHEIIARETAKHTKLILVEKPGVIDSKCWFCLLEDFPTTRIMMVKNNQFRPEIKKFKQLADQSDKVYIRWNNANRIPHPGSWFTTKEKAFGGVSRDLIPHMLSYYCALTDYTNGTKVKASATQQYQLKDIDTTDYGVVNPNGTYDVDDFCHFEFKNGNTTWVLSANWKTNLDHDDSSISFSMKNSALRHELGLCPKEAYQIMITTAMDNLNDDAFWKDQLQQDLWIHKQIESL